MFSAQSFKMLSQSIIYSDLKGECLCALLSVLSPYIVQIGSEKTKSERCG
jgi:hypothetical protein